MRRWIALGATVLAACGASLGGAPSDSVASDAKPPDVVRDAPVQDAFGPWSAAQPVPGADLSTTSEDDPTLNSTLTELYFKKPVTGESNDLFVLTRATAQDPWGPAVAVAAVNTTMAEESPRLSYDDKTLYFGRNGDIYMTTRSAVGSPWGTPVAVTSVNDPLLYEKWLSVCDNNVFMVSRETAAGDQDLFQGTLGSGLGTPVAELNSASNEVSTFLSKDCLTVYFASSRGVSTDIYTSTRATVNDPFDPPSLVPPFDTDTFDEEDGWISQDLRTFVYASTALGTKDVYISTR